MLITKLRKFLTGIDKWCHKCKSWYNPIAGQDWDKHCS